MKINKKLVLTLLTLVAFTLQAQGIVVVANLPQYETLSIQKREVRDLFMGNNSKLLLRPVALSPKNKARISFNTNIVGLPESRIQSYWAQMRFSGRKKPPLEFDSVEATLEYVLQNEGTVTYMFNNTDIPEGLTVIYTTEKMP